MNEERRAQIKARKLIDNSKSIRRLGLRLVLRNATRFGPILHIVEALQS